jgi:hypothetical protein
VRIWSTEPYRPDSWEPAAAVGIVGTRLPDGDIAPTGSCFRFGHNHVVLTARHCIPVSQPVTRFLLRNVEEVVERVIEHPTADIAALLLRAAPDARHTSLAFSEVARSGWPGEPFMAFGFPIAGPYEDPGTGPFPRVLTGTHQRFYIYDRPPYRYHAGEMSIPAPEGLSGAPLFWSHQRTGVSAMVTATVASYTVADSDETVEAPGQLHRTEARRVIAYGVSLILGDVVDWLRDAIPWQEHTGADVPRTLAMQRRVGP